MKDLFTIIVLHYNQEKYIFTALKSVLIQNYPNIELIVADDCSTNFWEDKIKKYIEENKFDNIKNVVIIKNEENLGTTKTLNKAIKASNGKYITFFAADDALCNKEVISNYVKAFKETGQRIITCQSYEYDNDFIIFKYAYVNVPNALKNNKKKPINLYEEMVKSCLYVSGATAYEKSVFDEYGIFNEKYKLVEDWSYWLYILKKGIMIHFVNIPVLKHRDGGVSHNTQKEIPPHVRQYYEDLIQITVDEVLMDMPKEITGKNKLIIYRRTGEIFKYYLHLLKSDKEDYYFDLINESINKNIGNELLKAKIQIIICNFVEWNVIGKFENFINNKTLFLGTIYWIILNCTLLKHNSTVITLFVSYLIILYFTNFLRSFSDGIALSLPITFGISYYLFGLFDIR